MRILASFLILTLLCAPARAAEFVYGPDDCEFRITFPEEPGVVRRCHDKITDKCDMMAGFTRVYDLNATVNFYVSCKPAEADFRKNFNADVMRTALLGRPGIDALEMYDITFSETEQATMSALFGAGPSPSGNDVMIYIAQIWAGNESVITVEGELIGHDVDEADQLFADILRSLRHKSDRLNDAAAVETGEENDAPQ